MIEKKVGWSTAASLAVTITFGIVHWLAPGLSTPPAYIVGGLATLVTFAAGYLAPHTHLRPEPPPERGWVGPRVPASSLTSSPVSSSLGPDVKVTYAPAPAVQPPATGTGTAAP